MKKGKLIKLITVPALLLASYTEAQAQPVIAPASLTEAPIDLHNFSYACSSHAELRSASTLNADMLKTVSGDNLWVVALNALDQDIYTTASNCTQVDSPIAINQIHVEYTGTPNLGVNNRDYPIPNAQNKPDVVIGCAQSWGPQQFRIGVVYNAPGQTVQMRTYTLTGIGGATPLLNAPSAPITLNDVTNGRQAMDPHIDLFGDVQNTVGGRPSLHRYVAVWNEVDNMGVWYVMAAYGDLNSPSTFTRKQITPNSPTDPQGRYPDVGAHGGGIDRAYIVFYNPTTANNAVNLATLNLTATPTVSITNAYSVATNTYSGYPRIDAQSVTNPTIPGIWQFVASATNTSGANFVACVNNNYSYQMSPSAGTTQLTPVVGLGAGALDAGIVYYSTYSNGGPIPPNGDIWAHKTPQGASAIPGILDQYLEANQIDLRNALPYTNTNDVPVAFANAPNSNTGQDILTVWYDGYDSNQPKPLAGLFIETKINNAYVYRPTSVNEATKEAGIDVYPNPATDKLTISSYGMSKNAIAIITDIAGRTILNIDLSADNIVVDIADLTNGIYLLQYKSTNTTKTVKFVKE